MTEGSRRALILGAVLCSMALSVGSVLAVPPDWQEKWRDDLKFLGHELRETHPQPFVKIDQEAFDAQLAAIKSRLSQLDHHQIVVALAELIASIGDGHSRVTLPLADGVEFFQGHSPTPAPLIESLRFRTFPVRFSLLGGELFVREVAPEHRKILGKRVLQLGELSTSDAIAAVAPTVRRDNNFQLLDLLPTHLVLAELLEARGVIQSAEELSIEVATAEGEPLRVTLRPQAFAASDLLTAGPEPGPSAPLALRSLGQPYWFEWLDNNVLYFQFNQVGGAEGELLDEFAVRLLGEIDRKPDPTLIVDLRNNPGGWYGTSKSLLRGLLRRDLAEQPGRLFVLTGRKTFSAAMMLAIDLERLTNAIFVGEPTGSSPNHHGDARRVLLPHSGMTVRISTLYWQAHPSDRREFITPHVGIEPTFDDYLAGADPVLDAAIAMARPALDRNDVPRRWEGRMEFPQSEGVVIKLHLKGTADTLEADWAFPSFGVESLPLANVSLRDGHFHGEAPWEGGNVRRVVLDGELRSGYLLGIASLTAAMGTERLPFVLKALTP